MFGFVKASKNDFDFLEDRLEIKVHFLDVWIFFAVFLFGLDLVSRLNQKLFEVIYRRQIVI